MSLRWADIGDTLNLTVTEMRSIRAVFGNLLGLDVTTRVPENLVPVIALIVRLRKTGFSDSEILRRLRESRVGDGWPDEVLSRMQTAATASAATLTVGTAASVTGAGASAAGVTAPAPSMGTPAAEMAADETVPARGAATALAGTAGVTTEETQVTAKVSRVEARTPDAEASELAPSTQTAATLPVSTVREMVMDLRREICTHAVEERELLYRMHQLLQTLRLEVRDLRYAFVLASSRKDRKRGRRGISQLLSG